MEPGRSTFPVAGVPGTTATAPAEKARQAGLWEPYCFIRKKWWEMFQVSVCLNLTWLKDDES